MIAYVQSAENNVSTSLVVSKAYTSNVAAGNLLICIVHIYNNGGGPGTITVTDTLGNTWVQAAGGLAGYFGLGWTEIWYCANCLGGANTVTATCTANGSSNYPGITLFEYSGVATSSPLEAHADASGSAAGADSGNLTTSSASCLLIGFEGNVTGATTFTPGAGWTVRETADGKASEKIVTPGTYSYSGTYSPSVNWGLNVIAFKAPGGAPPAGGKSVVCVMQ